MTAPDLDTELLLNAYVDGELDAASVLDLDRRFAADPELAARRDRLMELRDAMRSGLVREKAPDRLKQAMLAQAGLMPAAPPRRPVSGTRFMTGPWRMAMAACVVGVVAGSVVTDLLRPDQSEAPAVSEAVSDHLRAMLAPQPFDVASSDQHTVKPWFSGRLTFAPQVLDLGAAGFDLIGGRVDVMDGQPAAALAYRHGKHVASLISQPVETDVSVPTRASEQRGFGVRHWTEGGMRYWAVSDMAASELDAFEAAVRAQTQNPP